MLEGCFDVVFEGPDGKDVHQWFSMLDIVSVVMNSEKMSKEKDGNGRVHIPKEILDLKLGALAGQTKESGKKFVAIESKKTLLDAIKVLVENDVHRLATVGEKGALVGVLTDSRILKLLLATESNERTHPFNKSIKEHEMVGFRAPIWVAKDAPTSQAFDKMLKENVRSVAVIDKGRFT